MTRTSLLITLTAAAALAGCDNSSHTIGGDKDTNVVASAPVTLPPSISASKSYRCKDNQLIHIDWMSDGTARVKKTGEEVGMTVTPGTKLTGDAHGATITYNGQSCKA